MRFKHSQKDFDCEIDTANGLDRDYRESSAILSKKNPWAGWFAIKLDGKIQEYLVGIKRTDHPSVLLYSHALVQEIFYENDVIAGDIYDFEPANYRVMEDCEVLGKGTVLVGGERIQKLELNIKKGSFILDATEDGFQPEDSEDLENAGVKKAPILLEETHLPNVVGLLTREQIQLIMTRSSQPMIIQGKAGSGKTTVALYRLATLVHPPETSNDSSIDPSRVLYVMFNRALCKFIRGALEDLELGAVKQHVFYDWALAEIRRAYKRAPLDLFARASTLPGFEQATRLKKKIEILRVIEAYVARQCEKVAVYLEKYISPNDPEHYWLGKFEEEMKAGTPIAHCLAVLRNEARKSRKNESGKTKERLQEIYDVFRKAFKRVTTYKKDLRSFLTDSKLLLEHFPDETALSLAPLCSFQRELQGEKGTPNSRITEDDLALLLYLIQLKHGGLTDESKDDALYFYEHLVIDEAQDFGAIELKVLLNSIRTRHGVTIVGDTNQNIISGQKFMGWDALAAELDIGEVQVSRLEVAYRSTQEIMQIADLLVGDRTYEGKNGPIPSWFQMKSDKEVADKIAELIKARYEEQPNAHICVVCPTISKTRNILLKLQRRLDELKHVFPTRRGEGDKFVFAAGTTVALDTQVKGLEFDTVIITDPTGDRWHYPPNEEGRNLLYTAITRAQRQLFFVSTKPLTSLLDGALENEWIEDKMKEPDVVLVIYEEGDEDEDEPF